MVYYNEFDKSAAAWLRELIAQGHIAPGIVDERSISDVRQGDLAGFKQCHFFAGIGVWSYALRRAGWPDDRYVWTGSCPCQPFSAAGKGAGFDDVRHLWPHWFQLVAQCRPAAIFGEQVASGDGLQWLDLVCADLEAADYAVGAADLCAAGVGAPHIRQRLFWVADANGRHAGAEREQRGGQQRQQSAHGVAGRLGHPDGDGAGRDGRAGAGPQGTTPVRPVGHVSAAPGAAGGVADSLRAGLPQRQRETVFGAGRGPEGRAVEQRGGASVWSTAEWIYCRDDRWRPVEPGTFPLAHGAAARVGRLRGYGNAIVAQVAQTFIEASGLLT